MPSSFQPRRKTPVPPALSARRSPAALHPPPSAWKIHIPSSLTSHSARASPSRRARRVNRSPDARLDSIARPSFDAAFERARRRLARSNKNSRMNAFLPPWCARSPTRGVDVCRTRRPFPRDATCDHPDWEQKSMNKCYTAAKPRVSALAVTNGAARPSSLFILFAVALLLVVVVSEGSVDGFRLDKTDIRRERRDVFFVPGRLCGG